MASRGLRAGIQIVLAIIIVVLSYILYRSIVDPYRVIERQQELTQLTRAQMADIRAAMIAYESRNERYPTTLDSLLYFVQDSLTAAQRDSLFRTGIATEGADSLIYSPRTGRRFDLIVVDTLRVPTYLLQDPDTDDLIGTLDPDVTRINAASWE